MEKTKAWKWLLIIGILLVAAYQISYKNKIYSYPPEYEINNFPLISQPDDISCGPTSIAMNLKLYGIEKDIEEIKTQAKTEWFDINGFKIGGTSPEYIKIAMSYFGIDCYVERGDMNTLKYYVSQNRPPIVLVRSSRETWHYVVVTGYTKDSIIISDPAGGEREVLNNEIFEGAWNFSNDLHGRSMTIPCPVCEGDGKIWDNWGPLGICDTCGGSGEQIDLYKILVEFGDAKGYTMIIPRKSYETNSNIQDQQQQLSQGKTAWSNQKIMSRKLCGSV